MAAALLLQTGWPSFSPSGVNFFYYAVFIAAGALAWRFHSTRILFSAVILLLGHRAVEFFEQGRMVATGPGRTAFEAVALLVPLDFILLTFFPERGSENRTLGWFLALIFFESVFVAAIARPGIPAPGFLHWSLAPSYPWHVPQPGLLLFTVALSLLLFRLVQHHRATDSGMFWSLVATWLGFQAGGRRKNWQRVFWHRRPGPRQQHY